jgi:predicted nucleic acid-binding protein
MTKFVVDAGAVLQLVSAPVQISSQHELLAPTLLRSQALSLLHEAASRGEITAKVAHEHRARIRRLPIRLLGDAVLQRRAWEIADQLGGRRPTRPSTSRSRNSTRRLS